jgi:hypothetical protein
MPQPHQLINTALQDCKTLSNYSNYQASHVTQVILVCNYLGLYRKSSYVLRIVTILHRVFCVTEQGLMKDGMIWAGRVVSTGEMK